MYQILSQSVRFCRLYIQKHLVFFLVHSVYATTLICMSRSLGFCAVGIILSYSLQTLDGVCANNVNNEYACYVLILPRSNLTGNGFNCYSTPVGVRSIVINPSVCLSAIIWNRWPDLHEILCAEPCGRGSVLLWWGCDTLCTSGFMDDVT